MVSTKQHDYLQNKNSFLNTKSYIRMISEGSCDTEDWINDTENSALPSQE